MLLNRSFFLFVLIIGAVLAQVDGTPWWWNERPGEFTELGVKGTVLLY